MKIEITFFTYWHCGAGTSGGSRLDAMVIKDGEGLPYIPGKTLKGHIREMAETLNNRDFVNKCFGGSTDEKDDFYDEHAKNIEGECHFSNATLSEKLDPKHISYLYKTISSTAIGENGIAKSKSLREIEVCVPLKLVATISDYPLEHKVNLIKALKQVKRIGLNRTRGLGRCEISVKGEENG